MARCYVCGSYDCELVTLPGKIFRFMCEDCRIEFDNWCLESKEVTDIVETFECAKDNLTINLEFSKRSGRTVIKEDRLAFLKAEKELQLLMTEMVEEMKRLYYARTRKAIKPNIAGCDCNGCREEGKE